MLSKLFNKAKKKKSSNDDELNKIMKDIEESEKKEELFQQQQQRLAEAKQEEKAGNIEKAKEIYTELAYKGTEDVTPFLRLAILYRKEKNYDKEVEILDRGIYVFENEINKERLDRVKKLQQLEDRLEKAKELQQKNN
uniref:hypothetical protein n=1 Tax=uncultured Allobacillus sp. TaxID=1638025 RepID=UPI002594F887|nr:hypothetical protein [uncultured Allobacillus sp.]